MRRNKDNILEESTEEEYLETQDEMLWIEDEVDNTYLTKVDYHEYLDYKYYVVKECEKYDMFGYQY